jgi:transposase
MVRLMAIDLHRKTYFVVAADAEGQELWHRRFPTTVAGEASLLEQLSGEDRVVLEACSGSYRLANRLESTGAQVTVVDPQHSRLVGFRGKKTDYRDCRALLEHLRSGFLHPVWRPDATTREIRQLTQERHAYNQSIVQLKNRIRALLWEEGLIAPEHLWTQEGRAWLAEQTLAAPLRRLLDRELTALAALTAVKEAQEAELAQRATERPEAQRLMQLAGFGPSPAVMFLGQVGPVERFPSPKQLVSYGGLDPRVDQSGETCRTGSMSKAGRASLRWIMIEVAWAHVAAQGPEAERYQRLVGKGKPKGVAIAALARHLLVLAYHLLKAEAPYRRLNGRKFEAKLQRLAPYRTDRDTAPVPTTHTDWAAERFEALTGWASPYWEAHPRVRQRWHQQVGADGSEARAEAGLSGAECPA